MVHSYEVSGAIVSYWGTSSLFELKRGLPGEGMISGAVIQLVASFRSRNNSYNFMIVSGTGEYSSRRYPGVVLNAQYCRTC